MSGSEDGQGCEDGEGCEDGDSDGKDPGGYCGVGDRVSGKRGLSVSGGNSLGYRGCGSIFCGSSEEGVIDYSRVSGVWSGGDSKGMVLSTESLPNPNRPCSKGPAIVKPLGCYSQGSLHPKKSGACFKWGVCTVGCITEGQGFNTSVICRGCSCVRGMHVPIAKRSGVLDEAVQEIKCSAAVNCGDSISAVESAALGDLVGPSAGDGYAGSVGAVKDDEGIPSGSSHKNNSTDLFGFDYDNVLRIMDVNFGSMVKMGNEVVFCKCVLNDEKMRGVDHPLNVENLGSESVFIRVAESPLDHEDLWSIDSVSSCNSHKHAIVVNEGVFELTKVVYSKVAGPSFSAKGSAAVVMDRSLSMLPAYPVCEYVIPDCVCPGAEFARVKAENFLRLCSRMAEIIPETIQFGEDPGVCFSKDVKVKIIKKNGGEPVVGFDEVHSFYIRWRVLAGGITLVY